MEHGDDATLAGWHQDPSGRHELRFWNGDCWTEHVIDGGIPGLDFPTRSGRAPAKTPASSPPPPPDAAPPANATPEIDLIAEEQTEAATAPTTDPTHIESESESEATGDWERAAVAAAPTSSAHQASTTDTTPLSRPGGRSLRSGRRPVSPSGPTAVAPSPSTSVPDEPVESRPTEPGAERVGSEPASTTPDSEPELEPETAVPDERDARDARDAPISVHRSMLAIVTGPTVASPAGNSAGSNTSAIADPYAATVSHPVGDVSGTPSRVAGVAPVPVKRYRPGSPPPSPFARPQALLPALAIGTVVVPWYRKPIAWLSIIVILAAATVLGVLTLTRDSPTGNRLGGRPPAAAPQGSKVIDGDGFAIAAPVGWISGTEPGNTFPQLRRTNWQTPLVAVDGPHHEALVVVPLSGLRHKPQVDPEPFWSDQVRDAGSGRPISESPPFGVHGFRANRVSVTDLSGTVVVAASIDTGDRTFLVAFSAPNAETATTRFERFIQTFDVR